MNDKFKIICVACPKGCELDIERDGEKILVSNQGCKRGVEYAISEIKDPRRMVATTVRIVGGRHPLLPVYTAEPFPKGRIQELLHELRKITVKAPIKAGKVVFENSLGTGIAILASRDM
ncbi:MAG TPA: DUF1667 domain-containing protein [Anaerolineae bacterium]|nr:DUF1667 domain-containing protein [Anaerolineae bacterium]